MEHKHFCAKKNENCKNFDFPEQFLSRLYHVSIDVSIDGYPCSGALISDKEVLTSAQCVKYMRWPKIRLGASGYDVNGTTEQL